MTSARVRAWPWGFAMLAGVVFLAAHVSAIEPGAFYSSGSRTEKRIALTFDDGPGPQTAKFFELLDRHKVKGTFFVLGELVSLRPETAKAIVENGHEIASHTTRHINYRKRHKALRDETLARGGTDEQSLLAVKAELLADMKTTHAAIKTATGHDPTILRMPHGIDRPWIKDVAREMGYGLVNWTYGADWHRGSVDELLPGYLSAIKPGAILLFHDGGGNRSKSLSLVEAVIQTALAEGYEIVSVSQLLKSK